MTHFSDFSFLARAVSDFGVLIWALMHIYSIDRFEALRWKVIKRREVKSIMTILFLLSVLSLLVYDVICTKIKYTEGYIVDPISKAIISKPSELWSPENKELKRIARNILMLFYAAENSAVFLLQNFWNYLANKIVKANFISTWQFRINYAFIIITLVAFSVMPFLFQSDDNETLEYNDPIKLREELKQHSYEEAVPELAAAACNLIVLIYGLMAHFRFSTLIRQNSKNYIVDRLKYYRHMNMLLILIVAVAASLMFAISIDGLTDEQYLNRRKFTADLVVGIVNFFMAAFWIVWLMIFYPRLMPVQYKHTNEDGKGSKGSLGPMSPTSPTSDSLYSRNGKDTFSHKKSPLEVKHIEIKIDSTTTTMNNTHNNNNDNDNNNNNNNNNNNGEGYNNNNNYNNNYNNNNYNYDPNYYYNNNDDKGGYYNNGDDKGGYYNNSQAGEYYNNNEGGYYDNNGDQGIYYNNNNIRKNDYIRLPSPLVTNNKQIISYSGSPKYNQYQNLV